MCRLRRALRRLPILLLPAIAGCALLQEVAALRQVSFSLDRVSELRLAGVEIARVQRYEELTASEVGQLARAVAARRMPMSLTLHVRADNPDGNPQARITALDWSLYLQDRETVSGGLAQGVAIPAGATTDIPLEIRLDLLEFFEGSARDLANLALSLAGQEAPPTHVSLQATPTIDTPIGPIRYPQPLTITSRNLGR